MKKSKAMAEVRKKGNKGGFALSYAKNINGNVGKSNIQTHLTGKDIIYEVRTGATAPADSVITQVVQLNPQTVLEGTRLRQFAPLFQRYRFTKFTLRYLPVVNVEYIGSAIAAYMADPTQELSGSGLSLIQNVTQLPFRGIFSCWKQGVFTVKPSDMVTAPGMKFCCDPTEEADNVEVYQGKLYFISDNLTTANTLYGRWELDWGVEFYDPIITKAFNSTYYIFNSDTNVGQSSPWGQNQSGAYIGDNTLATLSYNGTNSVLTFPDNGQYLVEVYYPGSSSTGLTSSSVVTPSTGTTVTQTYIAYTNAQTGKYWRINVVAPDNGNIAVHDTAGTHNGSVTIEVLKIGSGPSPSAPLVESRKTLSRKVAELEKRLSAILSITPPSFPSFPGIQLTGESQTSTAVIGEMTDGNNPPKAIVVMESSSTSNGPVVVDAMSRKKNRKVKKRCDSEDDYEA